MDDLLLATGTEAECWEATESLLGTLQTLGYRVSAKEAQLCTPEVIYLGYKTSQGKRTLFLSRTEAVLRIPVPKTKRQVQEFLGAVGYCRLWIPGFAEIARPLYSSTGGRKPTTKLD